MNAPELQILGEKEYQSNMEVQKTKSITKPNIDLVVGHMYQSEPDIITDRINRELKSVQTESLDDYAGSNKTTNKFQLDENSLIMGVAFRQFIYASGLFSIQVDLQRQQLEQTQFKRRIIEEQVIAKVIDLFFQIHFGQQKLKLLKDINDLANKTYNIIIQKHDSGQLHQTDLTRSHINKLETKQNLEKEEGTLSNYLQKLSYLTGIIDLKSENIMAPCFTFNFNQQQEKLQYFLANIDKTSIDIKRQAAIIKLAETNRRLVEKKDTLSPKAIVFGSLQYLKDGSPYTKEFNWSIGGALIMPLYDGARSYHSKKEAFSKEKEARITLTSFRQNLLMETQDIYKQLNILHSEKQILSLKNKLAQQELDRAIESQNLNIITMTELLMVQVSAKKATLAYISHMAKEYHVLYKLYQKSGLSFKEQIICQK